MLWSVFVKGQTHHCFKIPIFLSICTYWCIHTGVWSAAFFCHNGLETSPFFSTLLLWSVTQQCHHCRLRDCLEKGRFSSLVTACQLLACPALLHLTKYMQMISMCWLAKALQNRGTRRKAMLFCWLDRKGRAISPVCKSYTNMRSNWMLTTQ